MLYQGKFHSIHRDKEYTVKIITNNSSATEVELTLGPSPFVTQMNVESSTIYSPIKSSSATIEIVGNGYMFDLYSSTAKQNKVELLDPSNNVIWTGYTQPVTYSVPFVHEMETYSVECLDGLGILQYFDYEPVGANKAIVSFKQILRKILNTSECYDYLYFPKNSVYMKNGATDGYLGGIRNALISEQCFYDEDDKAMKMNEVLTEICKYLNVSAVADGKNVYLIDYDYLKYSFGVSDRRDYIKINLSNGNEENVTVFDVHQIVAGDYSSSNSTLTLDNTYSKVTIKDSLYALDSIMPSLFEDADLVNVRDSSNWTVGQEGYTSNHFIGGQWWGRSNNDNRVWDSHRISFIFWERFYHNKNYTNYYYNANGTLINNPDCSTLTSMYNSDLKTSYRYPSIMDSNGALFAKVEVVVGEDSDSLNDSYKKAVKERNKKSKHEFTNYLVLNLNDRSNTSQKLLEVNSSALKPFFVSNKAKLLITGTIQVDDRSPEVNNVRYTNPIPLSKYEEKLDSFIYNNLTLTGKLKCGNNYLYSNKNSGAARIYYYWNTNSSNKFEIGFGEYDKLSDDEKHLNAKEFEMHDTTTVSSNAESTGLLIDLPNYNTEEEAYNVIPTFELYGRGRINSNYRVDKIWIKDFDIQYYMPYETAENENGTDTEYSYEINSDYVNELGDITFKICTWDGKQVNYSAVAYQKNGKYYFVDKLKFQGLGTNQIVRPEENFAYKIVNQYSTPSKKLDVTLFNDIKPYTIVVDTTLVPNTNTYMIVNSVSYDYVNDSATYNLVEKK